LTSDTHFGHEKIKRLGRPDNFEELIRANLKAKVKPCDLLIHLGDVTLGGNGQNKADNMWFKENLGCKTVLVLGNHDNKTIHWYQENGWDFVCESFHRQVNGQEVLFSHIPQIYNTERYDVNVHGHLHANRHRGSSDDFEFRGRTFKLVSLEFSNYQPIDLEKLIINPMNAKQAKKLRKYASQEKLSYVKQLYRTKPKFIPRFIWNWLFELAFVRKPKKA
jgi:calcineurin-like phosphoesterase family protein